MAFYIINEFPDIENRRYLELGTHAGVTFNQVRARDKTGVDLEFPTTFQMTTDAFFAGLNPDERYDIIFIDACHEYDYVLRDYNNAVKHLAPGGVILMHDMWPPSRHFLPPYYCGDGFKILHHAITSKQHKDIYTLTVTASDDHLPAHGNTDGDCGLTLFAKPVTLSPPASAKDTTYDEFKATIAKVKTYTRRELQEIVKGL